MVKTLLVPATRPDEPSPWWLKGGAIFIGVLGFSSLIGAVALALSGFYLEIMVESLDTQEICAEDPDPEECEAVFEAILQMSEMKLWDVGAAFSALLFLLSIPTAIIMWNAEDRDMALRNQHLRNVTLDACACLACFINPIHTRSKNLHF